MEVSGLAMGPDNSVFAHNDEYGIVYQISLNNGAVTRAFALGDPTLDKDFEGIEVMNGRVYLMTSRGKIYEAPIGEHKSRVKYNGYDTGIGDICETEGLTRGPDDEDGAPTLLILCKKMRKQAKNDRVLIYRFSLGTRLAVTEPWMDLARADLTKGSAKKFNPSALDWSETYQQLFIISAKTARYASVRRNGDVVQKQRLPKSYHRQAEGMTLTGDGRLVIADEGNGPTPPRLTIYAVLPQP